MAVTDDMLLDALKRRALRDIRDGHHRSDAVNVMNHIYGGGGDGGIRSGMAEEPDDRDYFVDIDRTDNPEGGWSKKVHRYTKKKVKTE